MNNTSIDINKNMEHRQRILLLPAVNQGIRKSKSQPKLQIMCKTCESKYVNMLLTFANIL